MRGNYQFDQNDRGLYIAYVIRELQDDGQPKMKIEIRKLSSGIGAEISNVDLAGDIDESTFGEIHQCWLDHVIVLFRGQKLNNEQQVRFSRRFGSLDKHDDIKRLRDPIHHEILPVLNIPGEQRLRVGAQWHSDMSHSLRPPKASLLRCEEIPTIGGDTMFSNMYLAYESLSKTMKSVVDKLWSVHDLTIAKHNVGKYDEVRQRQPPVAQPIVRVHPETGRKALYVSEFASSSIVGMSIEESRPILDFLFRHTTRPEFTYRHRWRAGDLIIWDNRSGIHLALDDYDHQETRRLYRTTIMGLHSGYPMELENLVT